MKALLAAVVASLATALAMQAGSGAATTARNYTLRHGDYVEVSTLHWTCMVTRYRPFSRYPVLDCNKDVPVSASVEPNVWVTRNAVLVTGTGSRPIQHGRRYEFRY